MEVLDADVVREKHRGMEGDGTIVVGQDSHAVARLSFCHVSYAWWTAVGRGPREALNLHASLALHTPCEWKFTHTCLAPGGDGEQGDVLHVVLELAEAGGVRLPFFDLPCIFSRALTTSVSWEEGSYRRPFFVFRLAIRSLVQNATSGAKVTLMVVPNVMHSQ